MIADLYVSAKDKIRIALTHYKRGFDKLIIISPGFFNNRKTLLVRKFIDFLLPFYDVICFDHRGHGNSGGVYTFGSREEKDLKAILDYTRSFGYTKIGLIGFSLGAAVALTVASRKDTIDSLALISCPANIWKIDYRFWEKGMLIDLIDFFGPIGEGKGVRLGNPFLRKRHPISYISKLDTPALFIHGAKDWVIKPWHSRLLFDKKYKDKKIEIFEKGLHAEKLIDQYPKEIKNLVLDWFKYTLR